MYVIVGLCDGKPSSRVVTSDNSFSEASGFTNGYILKDSVVIATIDENGNIAEY